MSRITCLLLCSTLALAACATAGDTPVDPVDAAGNNNVDAPPNPLSDAAPGMGDAAVDAPPNMPPDAMVSTPDAPPACTTQQLLVNPSFDMGGGSPWQEDAMFPIVTLFPPGNVVPHSGGYLAAMGTLILTSDELYQDVVIPAGTVDLTLRGQRWIETSDGGNVYDTLTVSIRDTGGGTLATLRTWSNLDASAGWVPFAEFLPQNFAGQTIRVHFRAMNDFSDVTTFSLDTLSLDAMVCN